MALPIHFEGFEVFPNSGHHIRFYPMMPADDATAEQVMQRMPELRDRYESLSQQLRDLIRTESAGHQPWKISKTESWLRCRWGWQKKMLKGEADEGDLDAMLLGLWVAVESNLGTRSRGYPTRVSGPPTAAEVASYNADQSTSSSAAARTPYAYSAIDEIDPERKASGLDITLGDPIVAKISFHWVRPDSPTPIDVDLIIDFGNTRTAVLALEHIGAAQDNLSAICRPIPFYSLGQVFEGQAGFAFDEKAVLVDSWFVLHETQFADPHMDKREVADWAVCSRKVKKGVWPFVREDTENHLDTVTYRIPQMFVELSPTLLGPSAQQCLLDLDLRKGGNYFLSSPKRYAWDTDSLDGAGQADWHMVLHEWRRRTEDEQVKYIPSVEGEMLRFMPADGSDWELHDPPSKWPEQRRPSAKPDHPRYPRSDTLAWNALAILENAYRVINSEPWRREQRPFGRRRLRQIVVTYPSGWTACEVDAYRTKWQKAINTFAHAHLASWRQIPDGDAPRLVMTLDEAIASQLPVIYSEIQRMGNIGSNWVEIVGRGKDCDAKARIMTIDIGGGTTDVSIVEYQDRKEGAGVDLHATVLFKDSSTVAGDELRRKIIEEVLLPVALGQRGGIDRDAFVQMFANAKNNVSEYAKWARYTRILLLPIVNRWLADLSANRQDSFEFFDLITTGREGQLLEEFNREAEAMVGVPLLNVNDSLRVPVDAVTRCIEECFGRQFGSFAKHVAAFECDMVIVTGKPSELPQIRRLLEVSLPIALDRLVFAHGYHAGKCWPLSADGVINDAKLVTVVGAALYQAIQTNHVKDWHITATPAKEMLVRNSWGAMPKHGSRFLPVFLEPLEDQKTVQIMVGSQIGRKLLPGENAPEPIYVLRWRDPEIRRHGPATNLDVTLVRVAPKACGEAESLALLNAAGIRQMPDASGRMQSQPITEKDVELKLCTLKQGESYWLDSGRFEVRWPEEAVQ